MPRFDYSCRDCNTITEITISLEDAGKKDITCSKCNSVMFKIFSAIPAHFKGTGWGKN